MAIHQRVYSLQSAIAISPTLVPVKAFHRVRPLSTRIRGNNTAVKRWRPATEKKHGGCMGIFFRDVDIDHLIPAHHQGPIPHWRRNWLRTSRSSRSRNWALEETRNSRDWSKNLQETMVFTRKKNLHPVRITFFSREEATCQRFFGNLWDILIILIS